MRDLNCSDSEASTRAANASRQHRPRRHFACILQELRLACSYSHIHRYCNEHFTSVSYLLVLWWLLEMEGCWVNTGCSSWFQTNNARAVKAKITCLTSKMTYHKLMLLSITAYHTFAANYSHTIDYTSQ